MNKNSEYTGNSSTDKELSIKQWIVLWISVLLLGFGIFGGYVLNVPDIILYLSRFSGFLIAVLLFAHGYLWSHKKNE